MSKLNFDYVPLTFISDKEEIKKQIRNTLILIHLFEKYNSPVRLENLIQGTQYGYNASALQSGRNKFLRISDITEGKVDWKAVPYCNCDDEETYLVNNDDILIARTGGTTGKSFKIHNPPKNAIYAGYLIRIRAKKDVNSDYIYLFLHSFAYWSQIVNLNERNFRPKANAENLKSLIIPNCKKEIQDEAVLLSQGKKLKGYEKLFSEIETALSDYDKIIEVEDLLTEQLNQTEKLNQAILQEAVQGKLAEQNPKDEPASELLKRIKAEKEKTRKKETLLLPIKTEETPFKIPESWVWCRLGEICSKIGSGSTPKGSNYSKTGFPFFRSQNIYNEGLVYDDITFISDKVHKQMNGTLVTANDILLNITGGSLGRSALVPSNFIEGNVSQHVCIIRPILILNKYLHQVVLSPYFQRFVFDSTTGAGREGLPKYNLETFFIPLPSFQEQKRIVTEIENQFSKTKEIKEHIIANQQHTEQLLKALLHQAFEVTVNDESTVKSNNGNVIQLPSLHEKEENHFLKRKTLATYIINHSLNDNKFGDVKFEKLLHLSDYVAIKRNLGQKYYQQAAGPYDNAFTLQYFKQVLHAKWFHRTKQGRQFVFSAGIYNSKSRNTYGHFTNEELERVNKLINFFKNSDYEQPEIISTLYAVWNNRIIKAETITDDLIKQDFIKWDAQKIKYKDRLDAALQWMQEEGIVPDGWGNLIEKSKAKLKSDRSSRA
jgi:type I restriction enzyme, S subunit